MDNRSTDDVRAFVPGPRLVQEGAAAGSLKGLRFAAKDLFDVEGHITGCGNPDWARTHPPARCTAPAIERLLAAGADLDGKTVTDELAYSLNGANMHYGTPVNTAAPDRLPGGSSSGSAAAVAGELVEFALGTDTGGSIRIPASYCGLWGLRPTHGRVPVDGVMPLAPSFDAVGWLTRDCTTLRRAGEVLLGPDAVDWHPGEVLFLEDAWREALSETRPALEPWFEQIRDMLGDCRPVAIANDFGGLPELASCFRTIQGYEIWSTHGEWIRSTEPTFAPDISQRLGVASTISSAEASEAGRIRTRFTAALQDLIGTTGLAILPTAPGPAPLIDEEPERLVDHRNRLLAMTAIAGLSGLPQLTMPLGLVEGCPVGLSLIGPAGADMALIAMAERVQGLIVER